MIKSIVIESTDKFRTIILAHLFCPLFALDPPQGTTLRPIFLHNRTKKESVCKVRRLPSKLLRESHQHSLGVDPSYHQF